MFYLGRAGLISRRGEAELATLSDQDLDGDADFDPITAALGDAEGEINSYLGTKYDLPFPGVTDIEAPELNPLVPAVLRRVTADIAVYRLAVDYGGTLTDEKRKRYEDCVKWLEGVAAGEIVLGEPTEPPAPGGSAVRLTTMPRLFTRITTRGI